MLTYRPIPFGTNEFVDDGSFSRHQEFVYTYFKHSGHVYVLGVFTYPPHEIMIGCYSENEPITPQLLPKFDYVRRTDTKNQFTFFSKIVYCMTTAANMAQVNSFCFSSIFYDADTTTETTYNKLCSSKSSINLFKRLGWDYRGKMQNNKHLYERVNNNFE